MPANGCSASLTILEQESSKAGRSLNIVDKLKPWMIDAGFRDVQVQVYKVRLLQSLFFFSVGRRLSSIGPILTSQ